LRTLRAHGKEILVPGLLDGKNIFITGVLTDASIAFAAARVAQNEGGHVILSSFGRALSLTTRIAKRLPCAAPVVELDATDPEHLTSLADRLSNHVDRLDGVVHSIAFAPQAALGPGFCAVGWHDAGIAVQVSAWSLPALVEACRPMFGDRASIVGLDFDAGVAWPLYGWMGVAKAALEGCCRYLARELGPDGVRVNLVAAGPLRTTAMKAIPKVDGLEQVWMQRAPLGWDPANAEPAGRACVALLSDWFPATTGEIVHVDGGYHAVGA
jgi:enoyl ACP reductase